MESKIKNFTKYITSFFFYLTIISFFVAFNFRDNPSNGWTLQLLPSLNGATISDVTFLDSLTGFITSYDSTAAGHIYKTSNGGNNWILIKSNVYPFTNIAFSSYNVGYCSSWDTIFKTTNNGVNWNPLPNPYGFWPADMYVLDENNIWVADNNGLVGGLFRTTDGGQSWIRQYYNFQQNPDKVYMVNKNLGFMGRGSFPFGSYVGRTTDGGFNWVITNEDSTFTDMHFIDSLTGWRAVGNILKTSNGGLTWVYQQLPRLYITWNLLMKFSFINKDTIYGVGGVYNYPSTVAAMIYKTTNGGLNWGYQIPDTNFGILSGYRFINFTNKLKGFAFWYKDKDIYTTTGGSDTTFYTGINNNSITEIPKGFELFQNYPNPFNQTTNIKYQITNKSYITLKVYDISGKEVATILNEEKQPGKYSIRFDSGGLASGIYFYQLIADGKNNETKKMIILK